LSGRCYLRFGREKGCEIIDFDMDVHKHVVSMCNGCQHVGHTLPSWSL
jgi:hypothetical protein